jgi:ethanolamine utilization protein EutN
MYLGIVKGTIVAERKAAGLEGKKLLLVQPVDEHGAPTGDLQAAVDTVQAGVGDKVLVLTEGTGIRQILKQGDIVPIRSLIVGIVDHVEIAT